MRFFGHGGGKIKRKSITTVLLVFFMALSFSTSTAFATDNITNTSSGSQQTTVKTTVTNQSITTKTNQAAGSPTDPSVSFSSSQINSAAAKIKTFVDTNNRLPSYVTINNTKVTLPQLMKLVAQNIINLNSGSSKSIPLTTVGSVSTNKTETVKYGNIYKSEYISLAKSINTNINNYGYPLKIVNTSLGKMNFKNTLYTFSKILSYYQTNKRMPNYVSVKPMNTNTSNNPPEGVLRPIYIISDLINNNSVDNNRINLIVDALKSLGAKAYNMGVGTDNIGILQKSSIPSNALIIQICGGACAGTIKETGSTWYKNLVGSKEVFYLWTEGATKITGLSWLPRAHDDNFSPASFTGMAHPDQYLLNNGYHYYEGYTNSKANVLAQIIYNEAKT
jgi:hypothetical protein